MPTIDHLIRNLESVKMPDVIHDAVVETTDDMKRLQRFQMLTGEAADDTKIGKYRNPVYAKQKFAQNPLAGLGNVDLRLKGDFYREILVDARVNSVVIDSADEKTQALINKYGEEIFGLNTEFSSEYATQHMGPVASDTIRKQIHK